MSNMKWVDEPPSPRTRALIDWYGIAADLRANPGSWALVQDDAPNGTQTYIKSGRIRAFRPAGTFESRAQVRGDGRISVYARFVGEGGAA